MFPNLVKVFDLRWSPVLGTLLTYINEHMNIPNDRDMSIMIPMHKKGATEFKKWEA